MPRRLITVTALAAGMSIAAAVLPATPALAKGPSQASITGPGLVRAIVVADGGEPGQQGTLAVLAGQTGLFTAMFGPDVSLPVQTPARLRTPPPEASLGPQYTVIYTVPGVTPRPGEQSGRIRQDLYPAAAGGPVVYTPPGQAGFGQPLQVTGWLRAGPGLARTLGQLGIRPQPGTSQAPQPRLPAAPPAAAHHVGSPALPWLIAAAVAIALSAALAVTALRRRHRKPAAAPGASRRLPASRKVGTKPTARG
jgi:hypothetical protein